MNNIIPLSLPDITEREISEVVATLRSGRLSMGPRQERFESLIAERCNRQHAIAVNSGTSGLHLVLKALGIGPGDEVITTPFSFIASANCILYVGATPVFVDIDPISLNMDPAKVDAAITSRTRAIIGVEVFGDPTHIDRLAQVAGAHEIPFIEDCCEALGGYYKKRAIGSFGRVGVFGFYPNKQITTGEGGMIVTDDDQLATLCRSLRNQGRTEMPPSNQAGAWLAHEQLGYNYRLDEISCAMGIVQMQRLDEILEMRRNVAAMYIQRLLDWDDLVLPTIHEIEERSWFVFVIRLNNLYGQTERNRIITGMRRHDIGASNYFPCIHMQPFYKKMFGFSQGDFPIAESISQRTIALPFYNRMDQTHVDLICHTLKVMIQREQLLKQDDE